MKMLITGGAGFIGSHLCDKYTQNGHTVLCLDNFMSGNLANMLIDLSGKKGEIKPVHVEPRIGEVKQLIANATKAKNLLGWEPHCKLQEGLGKFVRWYRDYGLEERMTIE